MLLKTAVLILFTTYTSSTNKPPEVETIGTFYGKTLSDAVMSCKVWGERQLPILPWEYKAGVFTRGFICHYNEGTK